MKNEFFDLASESRSCFRDCSFGARHVLFRVLLLWSKGIYVYFEGVKDYLCFPGAILYLNEIIFRFVKSLDFVVLSCLDVVFCGRER